MFTVLLAFIVCSALAWLFYVDVKRPANFPPGPWGLPLVGNTPFLRKLAQKFNGQHLALLHLAKQFNTSILGLKLGRQLVAVVFSPSVVREVLTRDEFVGRPDNFFFKLRCFGAKRGITFADGELWHDQRAFTLRTLRDLGMGKQKMEDLILDQVRELVQQFGQDGKSENVINILSPCIIRVLWEIAAGRRLASDDPILLRLISLLNKRNRAFDMAGGILNQFPWIRHFAPEWSGYRLLTDLNAEMRAFLLESVNQHRATYNQEVTRDLIDAFLHEMKTKGNLTFSEDQLVMLLLDLFLGGASSTSTTLDFAFLLMLKYPEVQEKIYDEIMQKVGNKNLPTTADKLRLPYTEAVLLEAQRLCTIIPITGPRRVLRDTTLNGYTLPEGTTILISEWSVHHDAEMFPDPTEFRPERFLDESRRAILLENLIPFGLGKRRCIGESLAKPCLFLIFAGILQRFQLRVPEGEPEPNLTPVPGIILTPRPYNATFISRVASVAS